MRFTFKGKEYCIPTNLKDISFRQFMLWQMSAFEEGPKNNEDTFQWAEKAVEFMALFTDIPKEEIKSDIPIRDLLVFTRVAADALQHSYLRIEPDHQFELAYNHYTTQWPQVEGAKFQEHQDTIEIRLRLTAWAHSNDWTQLAVALGKLIRLDGEPIGHEEVIRLPADKICSIVKGMEDAAIAYGWLMRSEEGKTVIA
jgi:hypothetical protein